MHCSVSQPQGFPNLSHWFLDPSPLALWILIYPFQHMTTVCPNHISCMWPLWCMPACLLHHRTSCHTQTVAWLKARYGIVSFYNAILWRCSARIVSQDLELGLRSWNLHRSFDPFQHWPGPPTVTVWIQCCNWWWQLGVAWWSCDHWASSLGILQQWDAVPRS